MRTFFSRQKDELRWNEARKRPSREDSIGLVLFALWLLLVPMTLSAEMDHTHSPASPEDCTRLSHGLRAVVAAMDGPGSRVETSLKPESAPTVEPGIHKLEVALRPLSEVWLVGKESLSRQTLGQESIMANITNPSEMVENLFGGFVRLTVPKDGLYRISADAPLWIEVIDGEKQIERVRIVPRLHCGRIHKSLGFPLQRERSYWLEMSGSKSPGMALLISEEPEH